MSDQQAFATVEPMLLAMDDSAAREPNMPVDIFIHESLRLYSWAQKDREVLQGAGLDWQWVVDLHTRAAALRHAQSVWNHERFISMQAQKLWIEQSQQAFDLRDTLLHAFRFAFRRQPDLNRLVAMIARGQSMVDKLQGLKDLAVAGRRNRSLLEAINFDLTLLDRGESMAEEMGRLYAEVRNDRQTYRLAKLNRDKLFTLLKETVNEVRTYGQYVFWREPQRKAGYISDYHRAKNQTAAAKPDRPEMQAHGGSETEKAPAPSFDPGL